MPLSIKDPETDALVRKLARALGLSLTGAVRHAVTNELARDVPLKQSALNEIHSHQHVN